MAGEERGSRRGAWLAGSVGSGLRQGISIFDLSSASFPSAFFVSCLAVNSNNNEVATTTVASFVYLSPSPSPLPLSLQLAHNANDNSAVRALSASTFNFQRQSAGVGGGEEGEGEERKEGRRECTEDLGHAIACATMQLTGDRSRRGAALPSASVARSG